MLVLSRKIGESILIGDDVTITITATKGNRAKLAIDAPHEVNVRRSELKIFRFEDAQRCQGGQ